MLDERCQSTFHQLLDNFLDKYRSDELSFMQYFEEYYASRCGKHEMYTLVVCSTVYLLSRTEKWAMCFRNFDHSDTDIKMHIERYNCNIHFLK